MTNKHVKRHLASLIIRKMLMKTTITLCLLAQPKEGQQQFKNKKQPELTENRTVWKSDNQGDKETFIQTYWMPTRAEMGSQAERTCGKAGTGRRGSSWWTR